MCLRAHRQSAGFGDSYKAALLACPWFCVRSQDLEALTQNIQVLIVNSTHILTNKNNKTQWCKFEKIRCRLVV